MPPLTGPPTQGVGEGAGGGPPGGPPPYFRAVAVDYDGTLAEHGTVGRDVLAAVERARQRGLRVLLVTGRVLDDLRQVFPEVDRHVDAVVAENGAVVVSPAGKRLLAPPVDDRLAGSLRARGVAASAGDVLLACAGADEPIVLEEIRRLGAACQLVRNRAQLMVLPEGVSKGAGLLEALGDLGISRHNTVAVGDAENDLSLLAAAEVGVAVANAVEGVRERADLVLERAAGAGVADLLASDLLAGATAPLHPPRWQIVVGADDAGHDVALPASQLNLLVSGGTGEGKSFLAGLVVEQLVGLGYSLLVVDPEGVHSGLAHLRGVVVLRPADGVSPQLVGQLLRHRFSTVVLDLAGLGDDDQAGFLRRLVPEVHEVRAAAGLPQWLVIDEAHQVLGRRGAPEVLDPATRGHCIVTYRPEELPADVATTVDALVALTGPRPTSGLVDVAAAVYGLPRADVARLLTGPPGRALLGWREHPHRAVTFTIGRRTSPHLRHERKYDAVGLPEERRFSFRGPDNVFTGRSAGSLAQLHAAIAEADPEVITHHCGRGDFSRWVADVLHDPWLARELAAAEEAIRRAPGGAVPAETARTLRERLLGVLGRRVRP